MFLTLIGRICSSSPYHVQAAERHAPLGAEDSTREPHAPASPQPRLGTGPHGAAL